MRYEWYADTFFLINFLMDSAGLLAAAVICGRRIRLRRILLTSASFVVLSMVMLCLIRRYQIYHLLVHLILNPIMIIVAFQPKKWKELIRELFCTYLVFIVTGGLQESVYLQTEGFVIGKIVVSGGVCIFCFVLWLIRMKTMSHICVADLWMNGEKISVEAFCDSGNLLRDPADRKAVSIVQTDVLPKQWLATTPKREIRFHTLNSKENSMVVITLDRMDIYQHGCLKSIDDPKIGLQKGELMQIPQVQMILHSSFL